MFTSLPPLVHTVLPANGNSLDPNWITLAETLQLNGYTTAAFTGAGFVVSEFGLDHGFEFFDDDGSEFSSILPMVDSWLTQHSSVPFFLFIHTYDIHSDREALPYDAPDPFNDTFVTEYNGGFDGCYRGECASELLRSLNSHVREGGEILGDVLNAEDLKYVVDLYDGGIAYVDRELGEFFKRLEEVDLYNNSLIIVTSDHG